MLWSVVELWHNNNVFIIYKRNQEENAMFAKRLSRRFEKSNLLEIAFMYWGICTGLALSTGLLAVGLTLIGASSAVALALTIPALLCCLALGALLMWISAIPQHIKKSKGLLNILIVSFVFTLIAPILVPGALLYFFLDAQPVFRATLGAMRQVRDDSNSCSPPLHPSH